jgi:hypothetical protein
MHTRTHTHTHKQTFNAYTHPHTTIQHLMRPNALVVPAKADIVTRLLESTTLWGGYNASTITTVNGSSMFPKANNNNNETKGRRDHVSSVGADCDVSVGADCLCWHRTFPSESMFVDKVVQSEDDARWQSSPKVCGICVCIGKCVYVYVYMYAYAYGHRHGHGHTYRHVHVF